jgi:hypothetical protein
MALVVAAMTCAPIAGSVGVRAADAARVDAPNYELASRWTSAKVGKLVFDTAVTPHWLEFSDRFWYSYETRDGKRYFLVDPPKKAKAPLFDNARMAAALTSLSRVPMDAQHLPIKSLKFTKKDTALLLEIEVPKDADIPGVKKPVTTTTSQAEKAAGDDDEADDPQDDQKDGDDGAKTKSIYFEYDLASSKLTLLPEFEPDKKPRWASISPDEKTVVFARLQPVHDGRGELREGAEETWRHDGGRNADHDRRRGSLRVRAPAAGRGPESAP